MTSVAQTDVRSVVDRYLDALNEPDAGHRRGLITTAWAPGGSLTDPPLAGEGHPGIAELADALHGLYPGHAFRRTSEVDAHHDRARFSWALHAPDGTAVLTGTDFAELTADGRVGHVTGFFGALAPRVDGG